MPDRIIRDELLTSERYWQCSPEARNLFLSIALCADDAGRFSGAAFVLRTRCMAGTVNDKRIEELLAELSTVDLIRPYAVDGVRYLFVPRFRQRKRYIKASRYPEPPKGISDITENKSDSSQTQDGLKTVSGQTEVRPKTRGVGVGVGVGVGIGDGVGVGVLRSPVATDEEIRAMRTAERSTPKATPHPIRDSPNPKPNGQDAPITPGQGVQASPHQTATDQQPNSVSLRQFLGAIPK